MYAVACIFVVVTSILADRQKTRFRYMMLDLILCFFGLIINRALLLPISPSGLAPRPVLTRSSVLAISVTPAPVGPLPASATRHILTDSPF